MDLTKRRHCNVPCPNHTHLCDRSPDHLGPHRDRQQKGTETCSWDVVEDVAWMRQRAQKAEAELERLRAELAKDDLRDRYGDVNANRIRRLVQDARQRAEQAEAAIQRVRVMHQRSCQVRRVVLEHPHLINDFTCAICAALDTPTPTEGETP